MISAEVEERIASLNTSEALAERYRRFGINYGWMVMGTIVLANVAALLASTMINVAIPDIMGAFGIGQDKAQWLATAFLAASTVTMLLNAWLIQALGVRAIVIAAMLTFMGGSILGGVSPTPDLLILARILQGSAAGVITPMSMSLVFQLFPAGRQGSVLGLTSIGVILAPAMGPLMGGYLNDTFGWRYVFYLGIPIAAFVIPIATLLLPGRDKNTVVPPLDWRGLALVSLTICALLITLSNGLREGWSSNFILSWAATALISGVSFIAWELRCEKPLLDLRVFSYFKFCVMSLLAAIFGAGLYGTLYLAPLFLQLAQGLTAMDSGLMMLLPALIMGAMFPISGRMADRVDQRLLLGSGFFVLAFSCVLMSNADPDTPWWTFCFWLIVSRIGIGIMAPTINLAAVQGLPMEFLQQGSGAANFMRQVGGAFGVNLASVALEYRSSFHRDAMMATQTYGSDDTMALIGNLNQSLMGSGLTFWETQTVSYGILGQMIGHQALVLGFQDGFLIFTVLFLFTLIPISMLRKRHMRSMH